MPNLQNSGILCNMGIEEGERTRICPKKERGEMLRLIAVAYGACGSEPIDTGCPVDCPRISGAKLLGIPLPSFIGKCPVPETPVSDDSDGHNLAALQ